MRALLAELIAALDRRLAFVYCVIAQTRGSTPRKAEVYRLSQPTTDMRATVELGRRWLEDRFQPRAVDAFVLDTPDDYNRLIRIAANI